MSDKHLSTRDEVIDAVHDRLESLHPNLLDGFDAEDIADKIINRYGLPVSEEKINF